MRRCGTVVCDNMEFCVVMCVRDIMIRSDSL
jgi:hypothetical protein